MSLLSEYQTGFGSPDMFRGLGNGELEEMEAFIRSVGNCFTGISNGISRAFKWHLSKKQRDYITAKIKDMEARHYARVEIRFSEPPQYLGTLVDVSVRFMGEVANYGHIGVDTATSTAIRSDVNSQISYRYGAIGSDETARANESMKRALAQLNDYTFGSTTNGVFDTRAIKSALPKPSPKKDTRAAAKKSMFFRKRKENQ